MELRRTETGFALYKEKEVIGHCTLHPAAQGAALAALAIDPAWRRKGYGSYLLKEVLRSFGGYDREAAKAAWNDFVLRYIDGAPAASQQQAGHSESPARLP